MKWSGHGKCYWVVGRGEGGLGSGSYVVRMTIPSRTSVGGIGNGKGGGWFSLHRVESGFPVVDDDDYDVRRIGL